MKKNYTSELKSLVGKEVVLAGWCHDVRLLGNINFLLLRDKDGIVQVTAKKGEVKAEIIELMKELHQEDALLVRGKVVESKIAKKGIEVIPTEIKILSKSKIPLPLDPREVTKANLDTRLNHRLLDLRTQTSRAIFKIQARILQAFREFLTSKGFLEIQPPIIISSASEGGAELFSLPYFEKRAFLAQSPQLYKQICALAFEKVFMVVPVFRAEKFDQPTHLNELRQMDIEQAFASDEEVMNALEECLAYILKEVREKCEEELEVLGQRIEIPRLPLRRIPYSKAIEMLREKGEEIEYGEDFSKSQERLLWKIVKEEAFFITQWPEELKAFYAMPYEDNPKLVKAFDLIYRGLEISSGTQRIHDPELLIKRIKEKGLDPKNFEFYIDCFRYGSVEHAGWSIGLERLTMAITGRKNIREVCLFPRDRKRIFP